MLVSACVRRRFFVASFEKSGGGLAFCQKCTGKKRGLAIKLCRAQSPAPISTRDTPHGLYKPTRKDPLGQLLFTASRRPWTLSVPRRRSAGAFVMRRWDG